MLALELVLVLELELELVLVLVLELELVLVLALELPGHLAKLLLPNIFISSLTFGLYSMCPCHT